MKRVAIAFLCLAAIVVAVMGDSVEEPELESAESLYCLSIGKILGKICVLTKFQAENSSFALSFLHNDIPVYEFPPKENETSKEVANLDGSTKIDFPEFCFPPGLPFQTCIQITDNVPLEGHICTKLSLKTSLTGHFILSWKCAVFGFKTKLELVHRDNLEKILTSE